MFGDVQRGLQRLPEILVNTRIGSNADFQLWRSMHPESAVDSDQPGVESSVVRWAGSHTVQRIQSFAVIAVGPRLDM